MRVRRVGVPARDNAGKAFARPGRGWKLILAPSVALFVFGGVAANDIATASGMAAAARPASPATPAPSASPTAVALGTGVVDPAVKAYLAPKQLAAVPVGPAHVAKPVGMVLNSPTVVTALDASGIPSVAETAYKWAASSLALSDGACHLPWQLLAAIGRVESNDGRFGGDELLSNGYGTRPIYGIPLDGRPGVALVRDTDHGKLDGDPNFDRAVGPMQFIPSTWAEYGVDGNDDGKKDPNNIFDAALGAGDYLCAGGGNMADPAQQAAAVQRYNDANDYVHVVTALTTSYEHGDFSTVPTLTGPTLPGPTGPLPTTGPVGPGAGPAPTEAPTQRTPQAPAPKPTAPASSAAATPKASPSASPAGTPSAAPTASPASTAPATPAPAAASEAPSGRHRHARFPRPRNGQTADMGWAPAMRQVVVRLLNAPQASPGQHSPTRQAQPAHHQAQSPESNAQAPSAQAGRRPTDGVATGTVARSDGSR